MKQSFFCLKSYHTPRPFVYDGATIAVNLTGFQTIINIFPSSNPSIMGVGKKIESLVRKAIFDFELLLGVKKLAVALSGGKDSLTLLYMLNAINGFGVSPFELHAVHVDGEFSCGPGVNASFLKGICKTLDVPLIIKTSNQKREKLECYSCSRERRKLLFQGAKEAGCEHIAFGHHRDDALQTLLMNLLHKGEFASNLPKVPMVHYGVQILRPLILVSEEDIIQFAKKQGFMRISCQCPVGQNSKRKKTEALLKEIEQLYPHARKNLFTAGLKYGSQKALIP